MKGTYEGFLKFINEQEDSREINHKSGFKECAIGEYIQSTGSEDLLEDIINFFTKELNVVDLNLARILDNWPSAEKLAPNYGALKKLVATGEK